MNSDAGEVGAGTDFGADGSGGEAMANDTNADDATMGGARAVLFAAGPAAFRAGSVVGDTVHRPALLFRAGSYPDKGVNISRDDLDQVIARFNGGGGRVPVIQEHVESPLDPLGHVIGLYRKGDDLWGLVTFSSGMHAHIMERGVQDLSVALVEDPAGGFRLKETSIVFKARVPGAGFRDRGDFLGKFRAAGKVTPAMEGPLGRLLCAPPQLAFSDGLGVDIADEIAALLDSLPVVQPRGPAVPAVVFGAAPSGVAPSLLTKEVAARLGVDPARIAAELNCHKRDLAAAERFG